MRVLACATAVLLLTAFGCSRIQYSFKPYYPAGAAVPVEVVVPHKATQPIGGTVYYRTQNAGPYQPVAMGARGDQLWAVLPTENLQPKERVEYYIDVTRGDELHPIRSPGSPFVVTFLGKVDMLLSSLRDSVNAGYDHDAVRISLATGNHTVEVPRVVYQMPSVPGDIRADMYGDSYRGYQLVIPPHAVHAGTWRYAIEVTYEGETYRLPAHGYRTFIVKQTPPPADDEEQAASASE
jgi:hypothetical protein